MAWLSIRNLWLCFGEQVVLERIDLDVEAGSFCTIVGASGCGKSSFLRILLGELTPTRGRVLLDGRPLPAEPGPDRGVVFQRYSVFPHLTAEENVAVGLELARARWLGRCFGRRRRALLAEARRWLEEVGLGAAARRYPAQLSGGMQQRLAIAQALAVAPRLLLLDEPFGALDPGVRADMHALVGGLWRRLGMTVFMVTHDIQEAFALGTRVLVFDKVRLDPQAPGAYGATITYDLPLDRRRTPAETEQVAARCRRTEAFLGGAG
ncbi:MAG: ABC transporter ATP-binding protein [Gammaproteobacteria bacterium]|nr:MAG: ABC transporter ATP-binding protein [Gammaproteobacteria bacterium]